jgi:glycerol kinase
MPAAELPPLISGCRCTADIIGVPIYTTVENQSAGCLGDAIIAGVGAGFFKDFGEAADTMVQYRQDLPSEHGKPRRIQILHGTLHGNLAGNARNRS